MKWTIHSWSRVKRNSPMNKTHEGMESLHNMSIPYSNNKRSLNEKQTK